VAIRRESLKRTSPLRNRYVIGRGVILTGQPWRIPNRCSLSVRFGVSVPFPDRGEGAFQVGTGEARELYYTADPLDVAQALSLGIVNRVVPLADLVAATMLLVHRLARGPRVALALMNAPN
jgi:hypothetical protein